REAASHCPNRFLKVASCIDFCYSLAGPIRPTREKRGACAPDWPHCTAHKGNGSKGHIAYPVRRQSPKPITKLLDQDCSTKNA
ncbi:hypothetical protein, partial [Bradyrhizobium sp. 23]|uniref:hypothetical protein n=1 Tax=Bradyrhizobium sp. 23 TaxID=2782667 RepID=UPI001FFBB863